LSEVRVDRDGAVTILTVDNQPKRNAFTEEMTWELGRRLDEADADPSVRCVVITGAGEHAFSSGHDLAAILENPEGGGDPEANAPFVRPTSMKTPTIAAVNGAAYAAGFILALSCDLRVTDERARFAASGARIGLVPIGGQLSRLLALLPYPIAAEMVFSSRPLTARRAHELGFVNHLAPPGGSMDAALEVAGDIAAVSPAVVQAAKVTLERTLHEGIDAGEEFAFANAARVRQLPDGEEGVRAFVEKRAPSYPDAPSALF
jgi:enoyl-CoA hydratase/carnithine racemase